jgi:hypothetical protein
VSAIAGVGSAFTVTTVAIDVAVHALVVTVTVYEPCVVAVISCVVAPVDHRYDVPTLDDNTTDCPAHNVVLPDGVMIGVTGATIFTTHVAVAVHPPASLTVTVYVAATAAVIVCVVAPVDHTYPKAELAVNVVESPVHRLTGDAGVIDAVIVHGAPQVTIGKLALDDTMIESISRLALVA